VASTGQTNDSLSVSEHVAGLYVHVPFCARRCPYCDFDITVGRAPATSEYLDALAREIDERRAELEALHATTLYLGGGTPSLLGPDGIAAIARALTPFVDRDTLAEATIELNPEDVDDALVGALALHGFDRVSLGVQTFAPAGLSQLGRMHDAARAKGALARCSAAGLRTSLDLIVGWPGQRDEDLARDLDATIAAGIEHVSIYALTIEAGTPWPKLVRRGLRVLPDDDRQAELLVRCEAILVRAGFEHYEIASYARANARARHNVGYWTSRDYVGLGPSAASAHHERDGAVERSSNPRGLRAWIDRAPASRERLTGEAAAAEGLWLGLRVLAGLDVDAYLRRFVQVDRAWLEHRVAAPIARGDLQWDDDGRRLRVAGGAPRNEASLGHAPGADPAAGPAEPGADPSAHADDPKWLRHDSIAAAVLSSP
jgi:oxygen-independent coproporphyrinogen-3 oxidase